MKLKRAIPFTLLVLVNIWVMWVVVVTNRWAIGFLAESDVNLPSLTRMTITVGWIWPLGAMILGIVGLAVAIGTRVSERVLFLVFSVIAAAELAGLGFHLLSLFMVVKRLGSLGG